MMQSAAEPYSNAVRRLFSNPRHGGTLEPAIRVDRADQGVRIALSMQLDGQSSRQSVAALRFKAWGCPHLIAATEAFCAAYEGRPVAELAAFTGRELMASLDVPVTKSGRILVLADTVRSLGAAVAEGKTCP